MNSKRKPFQCPFWDHEVFAEHLCEAGWSSPNDAQWSNLKALCDEALDGCRFNKEACTVQGAPSDRERALELACKEVLATPSFGALHSADAKDTIKMVRAALAATNNTGRGQ